MFFSQEVGFFHLPPLTGPSHFAGKFLHTVAKGQVYPAGKEK